MITARPHWAVPLTVVCTLVAIFAGTLPAVVLLQAELVDPEGPIYPLAAGSGVTAAAVLLVSLWRRFLLRPPWRGLGLSLRGAGLWQLLLGAAAAAAAVVLASVLSLATGAAHWGAGPGVAGGFAETLSMLAIVVSVSVLLQGFPEELLWRGHLHDLLSQSLRRWSVMLLSSVCFGLLHYLSQSPAEGALERTLYVVMATALGFTCAAARERTGAVWMAVGVHSGFHLARHSMPLTETKFGLGLVVLAGALTLTGLAILRLPSRWRPARHVTADQGRA